MSNLLAEMVSDSHSFVVVGRGRWHYRSVRPKDFYQAYYNELMVLGAPEQRQGERPDDDFVTKLQRMGPNGQARHLEMQEAMARAGCEGVSRADEACAKVLEDGHRCSSACFKSYTPCRIVLTREQENAEKGDLWIGTIPAEVVYHLYVQVSLVSTEAGRMADRLATFRGGSAPAEAPHDGGGVQLSPELVPGARSALDRSAVGGLDLPPGGTPAGGGHGKGIPARGDGPGGEGGVTP
jgi:hypothetical protein